MVQQLPAAICVPKPSKWAKIAGSAENGEPISACGGRSVGMTPIRSALKTGPQRSEGYRSSSQVQKRGNSTPREGGR